MTFARRLSRPSCSVAGALPQTPLSTYTLGTLVLLVLMMLASVPANAAIATPPAPVPAPAPPAVGGNSAPGVNDNCLAAAASVSEARVALDKARMDEIVKQPVSVLMSTCNNQSAGVSASVGGDLFSGDFMSDLQPIVGSALGSFYDDFDSSIIGFFGDIIGFQPGNILGNLLGGVLGGTFGSGAATLQNQYNCEGMQQQWEAMANAGISTGIPFVSIAQLLGGTLPAGAGEGFRLSFQASAGNSTFSNANTRVNALPRPNVPSFANVNSLCDALRAAGNSPAGCP